MHTATFGDVQVRLVRGWPRGKGEWTLPVLMRDAESAQPEIAGKDKKKHYTPGFFCESVRMAAQAAHSRAGEPIEQPSQRDWGRFAEVGRHTGCMPPTTCWSLVVAALECVLRQTVRSSRLPMCLCCATCCNGPATSAVQPWVAAMVSLRAVLAEGRHRAVYVSPNLPRGTR